MDAGFSSLSAGNMPPITVYQPGITGGTPLTNPLAQFIGNINNFTQVAIQNLSAGANASSDHIAYPDNNANDATGFADMGMTSSAFAQAAYSVTGPNEAYFFGSAPASSGKTGDIVFATDSSGTSNAIRWYTNGFAQAIGAYAMKLTTSGLLQVCKGLSIMGKVMAANGAATTYTLPAGVSYARITTSAIALAITLPSASAAIDGLLVTILTSVGVATVTWVSTGASFVGGVSASLANTPIRMIYDHASTTWYPA